MCTGDYAGRIGPIGVDGNRWQYITFAAAMIATL